jgi:hypothetical protein
MYDPSHHRGKVTAPYGRPNLRSRLHFGHNQEGGPRSLYGHVVALKKNNDGDRACVSSQTQKQNADVTDAKVHAVRTGGGGGGPELKFNRIGTSIERNGSGAFT